VKALKRARAAGSFRVSSAGCHLDTQDEAARAGVLQLDAFDDLIWGVGHGNQILASPTFRGAPGPGGTAWPPRPRLSSLAALGVPSRRIALLFRP
jgi:hypothetical protein